jgi:hypothetical protein
MLEMFGSNTERRDLSSWGGAGGSGKGKKMYLRRMKIKHLQRR